MKKWILYFLAIAVIVVSVPFVVSKSVVGGAELTLTVRLADGSTEEIGIEDYVLRVLAAREDDVCSLEAKKAFAVAARSVGMYFAVFGCKHNDFDCCGIGECCVELALPEKASESTKNAVEDTLGQFLAVGNAPAMALFTLCASSGTVQSKEFDYLEAVESGRICETHRTERSFTAKEVLALFPDAESDLKFYAVYGESNKLEFAIFANRQISGDDLMNSFGVKSREIEISGTEDGITVVSRGVGHAHGLDLCGAEVMAKDGAYYRTILEFYFPKLNLRYN